MHAGEGQIPLGLEAVDPHHVEITRSRHCEVEQRRLADARIAVEHQCAAVALTSGAEQTVQLGSLGPATEHLPHAADGRAAATGPAEERTRGSGT